MGLFVQQVRNKLAFFSTFHAAAAVMHAPKFFLFFYFVHISGTITESWIEYCSCIAARDFCLGVDIAIMLQFQVSVKLQESALAFASRNILVCFLC